MIKATGKDVNFLQPNTAPASKASTPSKVDGSDSLFKTNGDDKAEKSKGTKFQDTLTKEAKAEKTNAANREKSGNAAPSQGGRAERAASQSRSPKSNNDSKSEKADSSGESSSNPRAAGSTSKTRKNSNSGRSSAATLSNEANSVNSMDVETGSVSSPNEKLPIVKQKSGTSDLAATSGGKDVTGGSVGRPNIATKPYSPVGVASAPSVSPAESAELVGQGNPAEQKELILKEFMADMQDAFGVEPQQLVQAMASLSDDELQRTPESTMNLVLNQLSLQGGDRKLAEHLYTEMLNATAAVDAAQLTAAAQNKMSIVDMRVSSEKEVREQNLTKGLDQLNKDFFGIQTKEKAESQAHLAATKTKANPTGKQTDKSTDKTNASLTSAAAAAVGGGAGRGLGPSPATVEVQNLAQSTGSFQAAATDLANSLAASSMNAGAATNQLPSIEKASANPGNFEAVEVVEIGPGAQSLEDFLAVEGDTFASESNASSIQGYGSDSAPYRAANAGLKSATNMINDTTLMGSSNSNVSDLAVGQNASSFTGLSLSNGQDPSSDANYSNDKNKDEFKESNATVESATFRPSEADVTPQRPLKSQPQQPLAKAEVNATPALVPNSTNNRSERIENMRQILNRAEVLAGQGGGEVKVHLNPANLGQVHLTVKVQEGRVNIQMVTESDQAKKMIEGGLRELRTELNDNNLRLEGLQVDVSKGTSGELKQNLDSQNQNAQEQAKNMAQEFARGFMGQNRDERLWQREQFLADPMARPINNNYARSRIEDNDGSSAEPSKGSSGQAKRLNVVV